MTIRAITSAALATLALASLAFAETKPCVMTYEQFEFAVPHIDMETCPAAQAGDDRFCRAVANSDALHVFAFAPEGAQCLVSVVAYDEDTYAISLK